MQNPAGEFAGVEMMMGFCRDPDVSLCGCTYRSWRTANPQSVGVDDLVSDLSTWRSCRTCPGLVSVRHCLQHTLYNTVQL